MFSNNTSRGFFAKIRNVSSLSETPDNYEAIYRPDIDVKHGVRSVRAKVEAATARRSKDLPQITPRLVAVSKLKPISHIIEAYNAGQRHFGEIFVNELVEKATDSKIRRRCKDIKWHFIGELQIGKVNKLLPIPGLFIIESVNSEKLAERLDKQWNEIMRDKELNEEVAERLNLMVQVNTNGNAGDYGIEPGEVITLVEYILKSCPSLHYTGLMTMGETYYNLSKGPNYEYQQLVKLRNELCKELNLNINDIELSMGMSGDFEHAIELGSTNVRVGANIFGARIPKINKNI